MFTPNFFQNFALHCAFFVSGTYPFSSAFILRLTYLDKGRKSSVTHKRRCNMCRKSQLNFLVHEQNEDSRINTKNTTKQYTKAITNTREQKWKDFEKWREIQASSSELVVSGFKLIWVSKFPENNQHRTSDPSNQRTSDPPNHLTSDPSNHRTNDPSNQRSIEPSNQRTTEPPIHRTIEPTIHRTNDPSNQWTTEPPIHRTNDPTIHRTTEPLNQRVTSQGV